MGKVTLYREVKVEGGRRYVRVELERRGRRSAAFYIGPFYLRYGTKYECVGHDFAAAVKELEARQARLDACDAGVELKDDDDPSRIRIAVAIKKFLGKKSLFKDAKTLAAYTRRLGKFADWCTEAGIKFIDQIATSDDLLPCITFLRAQRTPKHTLWTARTVHNCFETINTFLRENKNFNGGEILGQLDFVQKEVKPYQRHELDALFAAADEEEKLWMSYFLNTGCRENEVAHAEYCDLRDDVNVVHVRSKPHRGFKLKGKRWANVGRMLPIPQTLMDKLRDRMVAKGAQPGDLIFPNRHGAPQGHFLRMLQSIAERAGVVDAELHRFRKTYADTLSEEGKPVITIMKRLGHSSLDVTMAYLRGCDAESEVEQDSANTSVLAVYA